MTFLRRALFLLSALCLVSAAGCGEDEALKITSVEPEVGTYEGGDVVTIHGSGFQAGGAKGVKVYFGGRSAKILRFEGNDELKVESPAGTKGEVVDILVVFDDARRHTYPKAFTYTDPAAGFGVEALTEGESAATE